MRKILSLMVVAAVAMPAAIAGATKPTVSPGQANPHKGSQPKVCKAAKKKSVTFIVRGVLVQNATATALLVDVTSVNKHAKKALAGPTARGGGVYSVPMLPVKIDNCTHITRNGKGPGKRSWTTLTAGDRVVVAFSAKRGTAYADLGAARRVVDRGPKR